MSLLLICAILSLIGHATASNAGSIFLNAASRYVNDKNGLIQLYVESLSTTQDAPSKLDIILEDMVNYARENEDADAPRHILTLLSDDQGHADIGYNDDTFHTPTLDILASNGVKFDSYYSQVRILKCNQYFPLK
jgi:hypothetical protein